MNKQNVTIYDVARESGVSMATVSRVVNGTSNVRPSTKKKVMDVIDKLNYRPNEVARGLASKRTTTVGVIIPDVTNNYFASLARGIDDIAAMYKYNIILANSDGKEQKELKVINTLLSKQVDGIIFMGNEITPLIRKSFKNANIPIVLAGSVDSKKTVPSVNIDYKKAIENVTCELIKHNNNKIAFVSGDLRHSINADHRLKGYCEALKKNNLKYNSDYVFETNESYKDGYSIGKDIFNKNIEAAVVTDDSLAAGILNWMNDHNVSIPNQFEIITSNDTQIADMMRPKMSSITQPLYDIGAVAMRLLTKIMNGDIDDGYKEHDILLQYGVINRETTKK
ncbi:catabolite control protein A [Apilactobacillus sp. TMW 2.2459]|uniref:catabolite control protein A n=1 Tax=Apilactobacillus xinyiensis TaxID=2841032 RepID=UPI001C7E1C86|nr:catabolite control protein A [Apilactobacillus xinyiensis]MCL0312327.1 catabolite control protein A [Apilactobacillus xinyiensis]